MIELKKTDRAVANLSSQRPGFAPGSVHMGSMADNMALG
jgi:hypothetical protein